MKDFEDVTIEDDTQRQFVIGFFAGKPVIFVVLFDGKPISHEVIRTAATIALNRGKTKAQIAWIFNEKIAEAGHERPLCTYIL